MVVVQANTSDDRTDQPQDWPVEGVPDDSLLYLRVHRSLLKDGTPLPGAFKNRPDGADGMSTNWDRYATPAGTRAGGKQPPDAYAVVSLQAGPVRALPGQEVEHRPVSDNRAHSEVVGIKSAEVRVKLRDLHRLVIAVDASS
jgi:hypothetical protein